MGSWAVVEGRVAPVPISGAGLGGEAGKPSCLLAPDMLVVFQLSLAHCPMVGHVAKGPQALRGEKGPGHQALGPHGRWPWDQRVKAIGERP